MCIPLKIEFCIQKHRPTHKFWLIFKGALRNQRFPKKPKTTEPYIIMLPYLKTKKGITP